MKTIITLLCVALGVNAFAQTTISNGGFESWGNTVPAGDTCTEPTGWYSNESGSSIARLGSETCFKDATVVHSGSYSVRVQTIPGPLSTAINGNVTTGVVNAPTILSKDSGYIGTVNYSTPTDDRRMSFTARPDSIVGWYQYLSGGTGEQGKIRAILHTGDYYDPETPTNSYHPNPIANKIADALFLTPTSSVSTWTRFSVPFTYVSASSPVYIMVNVTSSANQGTTVTGSTLWLDDLQVAYNIAEGTTQITATADDADVYASGQDVYVNFRNRYSGYSTLSIYDLTGRTVFSHEVANNQLSSFTPGLRAGVYLFGLSNNGFHKTGKLFIQ